MNSKYDNYGVSIGTPLPDIREGDLVEFCTQKSHFDGRNKVTVKVYLHGIWDGEKVCFTDSEHTIVRTTHWLSLKVRNIRNIIRQGV
jgi:hypothetical protein